MIVYYCKKEKKDLQFSIFFLNFKDCWAFLSNLNTDGCCYVQIAGFSETSLETKRWGELVKYSIQDDLGFRVSFFLITDFYKRKVYAFRNQTLIISRYNILVDERLVAHGLLCLEFIHSLFLCNQNIV